MEKSILKSTEALRVYLEPLGPFLSDAWVSEISVNEPGSLYIERGGVIHKEELPSLTYDWLLGISKLIAQYSDQRLSEAEPLLSASLPEGHRIQVVLPPASNHIVLSIRKQVVHRLRLDDFEKQGAFAHTRAISIPSHRSTLPLNEEDQYLTSVFKSKNYTLFLKEAIAQKKNILVSGGTSTGKTTFLNACLREIPLDERIITLEDVREIEIPHENKVHLIASKGEQGLARVSMSHLIEACLRLRPDRIIMGELRGSEASDFINATATGHDGSIASIHASNPSMAFMRLVHMVKMNPAMQMMERADILEDLHTLIDIVVQIKRVREGTLYRREISEIYSGFNFEEGRGSHAGS